jgi:DNA-binding response OmpR family regulator
MRILVAEDDPVSRRVLEVVLSRLGHECRTSEDGEQAWAAFQADPPDVLITDWMMPGLAGPDLCRLVREHFGREHYIVMLTALAGDAEVRTAMECGADDFLTKPLDRTQLTMRLNVAEQLLSLRTRVAELERKA